MSGYKTIVVAVDLSEDADAVITRARDLAASSPDATLHLIHVIEPLSFAYGGDIPVDLSGVQEEIQRQTEEQLKELAAKYAIPATHRHLVLGRPATEVHALADEQNADLIVVGSHGRHGIALLLGSTANAVLHGASCDILAVKVGSD